MTANSKRSAESQEFLEKMATEGTLQWIDDQIKVLKDGAKMLEARKKQFNNDTFAGSHVTKVNVLAWAVNDIANVHRNLRLDLAVNHSSALALSQVKS